MENSILVALFGIQQIIFSAGHIIKNTESEVVDDTVSSATTIALSCVCLVLFISITAICTLRRRSRTEGIRIYTDITNRPSSQVHTYMELHYQDLNLNPNPMPHLNPNPNPNHEPPSKDQDRDSNYEEVAVLPWSRGPVARAVQMTSPPAARANSPAAFK